METVNIKYSKTGIMYTILMSLIIMSAIVYIDIHYLLFNAIESIYDLPFFIMAIEVVASIMAIYITVKYIRLWKMANRGEPAIILTPEQYIDNVNMIQVNWRDVASVMSFRYGKGGGYFLSVDVKDNDIVYKQIKSDIVYFFFSLRTVFGYGVLRIEMVVLAGGTREVTNTIENYFNRVKGHHDY